MRPLGEAGTGLHFEIVVRPIDERSERVRDDDDDDTAEFEPRSMGGE